MAEGGRRKFHINFTKTPQHTHTSNKQQFEYIIDIPHPVSNANFKRFTALFISSTGYNNTFNIQSNLQTLKYRKFVTLFSKLM